MDTNCHLTARIGLFSCLILAASCSPTRQEGDYELRSAPEQAYRTDLPNRQEYLKLVRNSGELTFAKFSLFLREPTKPIYYQNTTKYEFHLNFLRAELPPYSDLDAATYENLIFNAASKEIAAGAIYHSEKLKLADFDKPGVLGFTIYYRGDINLEEIAMVHAKLKETAAFAGGQVAFVFEKTGDYFKYKKKLKAKGVASMRLKQLMGKGDRPQTYNPGESYGYLKSVTIKDLEEGNYGAKDIVVLDSVPLDIGPVSGIITSLPQAPHSHIIFRAINQGIPNAFVPNAVHAKSIAKHADQLVRFELGPDGQYTITGRDSIPDIESKAEQYFRSRVPKLPPLTSDLGTTQLLGWQAVDIGRKAARTYGSKGTNFAILDRALREKGFDRSLYNGSFLIPFSYYSKHIDQKVTSKICKKGRKECQGDYPDSCGAIDALCVDAATKGASLRQFLAAFSTPARTAELLANAKQRKAELTYVREAIEKAPLDKSFKAMVAKKISEGYPPNRRIRFRSSTNAEDLPGLTGAGLYESKSACLGDEDRSEENSACRTPLETRRIKELVGRLTALDPTAHAPLIKKLEKKLTKQYKLKKTIPKVYASLWTEKAFLNRDYYGIKHSDVYMGMLVHPSFIDENANGVAIVTKEGEKYRINIAVQQADISVTNPAIPGTLPDQFTVDLDGGSGGAISQPNYLMRSTLTGGQPVLDSPTIQNLARQLRTTFDAMRGVYGAEVIKRLDSEFVIDSDKRILIKQARPL